MRSKLFVPASRPELFDKAELSEADAISYDLEDAVDEALKDEARALLSNHLSKPQTHGKLVIVRVNGVQTPHFEADIAAVARDGLDLVNLPKIEDPSQIHAAVSCIETHEAANGKATPLGILVNIESATGLQNAAAIAQAHPRIMGMQIGFGDLFAPLGIAQTNTFAIAQVRWCVRMAAAQAGIDAYDGAFISIDSPDAFVENARAARDMGFAGKSCIHPSQIALANEVFQVDPKELAYALKVVRAADDAKDRAVGAFVVDGRLVDGPFISRARRIVSQARKLSTQA